MITAFLNWIVPFLCGGAVSIISASIALRHKKKAREEAMGMGLQCLLRAEIIRQHEKWMALCYCPIYAKEALKRAYAAYHALGGNDIATNMVEDLMALSTELPNSHNL